MINFAWEESIDQNTDDQINYNITVINENTGQPVLDLGDIPDESLPVPLSFLVDSPVDGESLLFSWNVIATDNSEGSYSTECNEIFEFTLRFESLGIDDDILIPEDYILGNSYPNPFNPRTSIEYGVPESSVINLSVYDSSLFKRKKASHNIYVFSKNIVFSQDKG